MKIRANILVMNLINELHKAPSKAQRDRIVAFIGANQNRFDQLVDIFLAGPYRLTQRAAWPLSYCVEKHPDLVKPHLKKMLNLLGRPAVPVSVKRNTVRLLQFINVPKALQGKTAAICFGFLADVNEPVAVRVFAMTVLGNIATLQPALAGEIKILIEDQLPFASAGFISRARRVLKAIR